MNVLVDRREIQEIKFSPRIGNGKEGCCYLPDDDNKIYKLFHYYDGKRKIYFDNLSNNQRAFPEDILIDKDSNLIAGYTMYYLSGEKFINGFHEDLNLEELKKAYLEMRLIILKYKDIYMDDNCLENMLYDYKFSRINLIDTSRWYPKMDGQIENINEFNWQMMTALLRNLDWKSFKLNRDKELFELYLIYKKLENISSLFVEFLMELEKKVSEYKQTKVKTIKDLIIK